MSDFTPYAVSVEDMMRARDERVLAQNEMLAAAASFPAPTALLSFGMNIPGAVKQTPLIRSGFLFGKEQLTALLQREDYALLLTRELRRVSGDSWLCLVGAPPEAVKRLAVSLEDSEPLARLFDIDVLDSTGRKLSREDFSLPPRRCLLCEEAAIVCARSRVHSVEALFSRCEALLREAFPLSASFFSALENHAALSLLDEVYAAPKPGLVDRIDAGAHADMKFEDFILSTAAISPFLREMALVSYQSCFTLPAARKTEATLFPLLREIGKRAEHEMYAATGGVNTHKGAVFTLGLLSAGAGLLYAKNGRLTAEAILDEVQNLVGDTLRQELAELKAGEVGNAHGEAVLHRDGAGGVRSAAAKGFPVLRNVALPLLRQYEAEGQAAEASALNVLLHLILHVSDTNVLYRGGKDALLILRADCRNILSHGGAFTPSGTDLLYELKETCKQRNVSPGGAADLLSAALFLHRLEKTFH